MASKLAKYFRKTPTRCEDAHANIAMANSPLSTPVDGAVASSAMSVAVDVPVEERPKIGVGSLMDVVRIEGKAAFQCDEGDIVKVKYINKNPTTKSERELVGGVFTGRVL